MGLFRRRVLAKPASKLGSRFKEVGWLRSSPFVRDGRCPTALHLAVKYSNMKALHQLIAAGAQPNIPDANGETPLHWAVRMDNVRFAAALIAGGADPNIPAGDPDSHQWRGPDPVPDESEPDTKPTTSPKA